MSGWDVASLVCLGLGAFFFFAGTVGLLRFPDALCRLHAVSKADTAGLGFTVVGLVLRTHVPSVALKLLLVWGLALVASAAGGQLVARVAERTHRVEGER